MASIKRQRAEEGEASAPAPVFPTPRFPRPPTPSGDDRTLVRVASERSRHSAIPGASNRLATVLRVATESSARTIGRRAPPPARALVIDAVISVCASAGVHSAGSPATISKTQTQIRRRSLLSASSRTPIRQSTTSLQRFLRHHERIQVAEVITMSSVLSKQQLPLQQLQTSSAPASQPTQPVQQVSASGGTGSVGVATGGGVSIAQMGYNALSVAATQAILHPQPAQQLIEFNHAINYVNKIKAESFSSET
ncbi:uncharacterized protein [Oscarella lobularis]|uniref:uncharacterized protein isoform X3 n=1 Tax=Oscarella lobularis TaxID=121494 RepID=UPI00331424E5